MEESLTDALFVARVCARPVSPVTMPLELSSVSPNQIPSSPPHTFPYNGNPSPPPGKLSPANPCVGFCGQAGVGRKICRLLPFESRHRSEQKKSILTKMNSLHCRSSPSPWVNIPPFLVPLLFWSRSALHCLMRWSQEPQNPSPPMGIPPTNAMLPVS